MALTEFGLIRQYFERQCDNLGAGVSLGIGDDAALLQPAAGCELVVATDAMLEGVHFPAALDPFDIAWRALASNLSDLAAMAATPRWFTLSLSLPAAAEQWLSRFSNGLFTLADSAGIRLVGGDTTRGPLNICITVMGEVPRGQALLRSGAQVGDLVFVSGNPGLAALGLEQLQANQASADALARFCRPQPRLALGSDLRGLASAAIDISDGLLSDLGHIAERSAVGIQLDAELLPIQGPLARLPRAHALRLALAGGDDYELCFTASPGYRDSIVRCGQTIDVPCTVIGEVVAGSGVRCLSAPSGIRGYDHFGDVR